MIGAPVLILGHCFYDETEEYWVKLQYFTGEDFLNTKYTYDPTAEYSLFKNQEEADKDAHSQREWAKSRSKYHGEVVHFDSIDKDVKICHKIHSFSLGEAESVEITKGEWDLLRIELNKDQWEDFDIETWGK
jgi:hypothetical protein